MLIPWDLDSHHKYKANPGTLSLYGSDVPLALSLPLGLGICAIHFSEKQNWAIKFRYLDDRGLQKLENYNLPSYGIWDLRSWHPIHLNFWDNLFVSLVTPEWSMNLINLKTTANITPRFFHCLEYKPLGMINYVFNPIKSW